LFEFVPPLLQFRDQFIEALVDVFALLIIQPLDFLLDVLDELPVVVIDPLGVEHELVQVVNVLLNDVSDIFQLCQLMPIMVRKHTLWTHYSMTELAKVLNLLVLMLEAEHLSSCRLGH